MFDSNVFLEGTCKNNDEGYELKTNITYYRGIPLSMVNDILVETDGEPVDRASIRCSVDDGEYWFTLDEMETVVGHKWEYGYPMTVKVLGDKLSKGAHEVKLTVIVRTAYVPHPIEGFKTRTVVID